LLGVTIHRVFTMPAIAPTQSTESLDITAWVPSPLYRWTLEQYEAMVDSGAFSAHDRFHLIKGYVVAKMTQGEAHCTADDLCGEALARVLPLGWYVRVAKPVSLPPDSKPEPDRCVVRGTIRDYSKRSPCPGDIGLIVEVADTSLIEDRKQALIYAQSGIPVYWIVNLVDRVVEVRTKPTPAGYASCLNYMVGENVPVVIDCVEVAQIAVADILP
jgi:Uma2 family endonuclease